MNSNTSDIIFLGDVHGDIGRVSEACEFAQENDIQCIVQLGDFGYAWPNDQTDFAHTVNGIAEQNGVRLYFLAGNHENWDAIEENGWRYANDFCEVYPNLFYIPDGFTWEWHDTKFGCIGGATSIDKHGRAKGYWWPQERPSFHAVERLGEVDILVSHETISGIPEAGGWLKGLGPLPTDISTACLEDRRLIAEAAEKTGARFLFHGHHHMRDTTMFESLKVVSVGANINPLQDNLVIYSIPEERVY